MNKNVILWCLVCLSSIVVSLTSQVVKAEETSMDPETIATNPVESLDIFDLKEIGLDNISPYATLTRCWTSGWVKTGSPAPQLAFFQSGAYRGWLSKYRELPSHYGTTGYYEGYFYHNSLPLPIPSRLDTIVNK